jgi:predicted metal-binding membrane protein
MLGGTASESARGPLVTYVVLLLVTAAAWGHVVWTALTDDMAGMDMAMTAGWGEGLAYVVAWGVMMAAMMLPSALPMIGLYAATQRRSAGAAPAALPVTLFTLIYLVVWTGSGVPIYLGSVATSALATPARAWVAATALVAAGLLQLSPLKQACLRHCRSPLGFFLGRWRAGWPGALALGWSHAVYCLGCCWGLMVVLVAAGAMGLAWVLLIAVVVAAEKLLPGGAWIARATGLALLVLGMAILARPDLAAALRGVHVM